MYIVSIFLFLAALTFAYWLGRFVQSRLSGRSKNDSDPAIGTVEGSLLAMFAFFLGFTFSISASKLENVRQTSIVEANAVGTTILRTKMYNEKDEAHFKKLLKEYLKSRIDYFAKNNTTEDDVKYLDMATDKFNEIWDFAVQLQKSNKYVEPSRLMLPALNDMTDSVTSRDSALNASLPNTIINTLFFLGLCSTFIIGFSRKKEDSVKFIDFIYIIIIGLTVNLIIDAGNPRKGLITSAKSNATIENIYKQL